MGLIAQTLYALLNPYGVSPPPLFVAQVLNRMLLGYLGGRLHGLVWAGRRPIPAAALGLTGLALTWLYDLTTDASAFFVSGFSWTQMRTTFALGLPYYLVHGTVNAAMFAVAVPLVAAGLKTAGLGKARERA